MSVLETAVIHSRGSRVSECPNQREIRLLAKRSTGQAYSASRPLFTHRTPRPDFVKDFNPTLNVQNLDPHTTSATFVHDLCELEAAHSRHPDIDEHQADLGTRLKQRQSVMPVVSVKHREAEILEHVDRCGA